MNKKIKTVIVIIVALSVIVCCLFKGERNYPENGQLHFSIDDSVAIFRDLTQNQKEYESIFENHILNFFLKCHQKFGLKVSFYCYYEEGTFDLSMVPDIYIEEFQKNSDWLQFGFHYINGMEPKALTADEIARDYQMVNKELLRITGNNIKTIRLSYFRGTYEMIGELRRQGVECLMTADDKRQSYYFREDINTYIDKNDTWYDETNDMKYISTDLRLDNIQKKDIWPTLIQISKDEKQNKIIAVFTHEWLLDKKMFKKIEHMCRFAKNYGYEFTLTGI